MSADRLTLDTGFMLGLEMTFAEAVAWGNEQGFEFVELLLDGPYARQRVVDDVASMRSALADASLDIVVHLPFAIDPGTPFPAVRDGIVSEFQAGMDVARDLGADRVVFHPSSDTWGLGWSEAEARGFVHDALDDLVPACRDRGLEPCLENIVSTYYDVTTFPELLDRYPDASMTFDTSHAYIAGLDAAEMAAFCRTHADRISHLHLADTRDESDEHLPLGMGAVAVEPLLSALDDVGWTGSATLEISTSDYESVAFGKRRLDDILSRVRTT